MLHECHYCHEFKGIQAFHNDPEDQICTDCYTDMTMDHTEFDEDLTKALILEERARLKERMRQIDEEELPF